MVAGGEQRRARRPLDALERGRERLLLLDRQHVEERHGRDRGELLLRHDARRRRSSSSARRITSESTGRIAPAIASVQRAPARWRRSGVSTEPMPRPPTAAASTRPNTRPATAAEAVRWISVTAEMSTTLFPIPSRASATIAAHVRGSAASASSGAPKQASPSPKFAAVRLRPTSASATIAPTIAPTPVAACRNPTPAFPRSSSSSATTTTSTLYAPATIVCARVEPDHDAQARLAPHRAEAGRDPARVLVRVRRRRGPLRPRDPRDERRAPEIGGRDGRRTRASGRRAGRAARRPPGPANAPMLSNVLEVTLAAVSSSGVSARRGMSEASAGRNAVLTIEVRIARP